MILKWNIESGGAYPLESHNITNFHWTLDVMMQLLSRKYSRLQWRKLYRKLKETEFEKVTYNWTGILIDRELVQLKGFLASL